MNGNLTAFQRFLLAFVAFFWVLFDRRFAEGVQAVRERTRELPPAGPAPAPKGAVKPDAPASEVPAPAAKEVAVLPKEPVGARKPAPGDAGGTKPAPEAAVAKPAPRSPEPAPPASKSVVETTRPSSPPPPAAQPTPELAALTVLGTLQRDGRLVDFLSEDLDGFTDSEIGVAARTVHAGCRKTLAAYVTLEPIYREPEGATVVVASGFDAKAIRITGNVVGDPPFRGALRHHGWRATRATFPPIPTGHDPHLLAPAEVELT